MNAQCNALLITKHLESMIESFTKSLQWLTKPNQFSAGTSQTPLSSSQCLERIPFFIYPFVSLQ